MRNLFQRAFGSSNFNDVFIALVIGLGTGVGAVAFRYLISGVDWVGYTWFPGLFPGLGKYYVIIIPAVGGLIVGPLIYFFAREAKGHGVPEVMAVVALKGGRIRPIVALIKSLASSISIGSGGSVGREGPIVQIGSAIGSSFGQWLNFSDNKIRICVACGAAAGIAATFNAPIAGVIFALEIILGQFSVRHFSSVVVSSVAASVIGRVVFGNFPAFAVPVEYGVNSLWEFAFYPVLGILAAFGGYIFVRVLYWTEDVFNKWKSVPEWIQPMFGGFLLGVIALVYPRLTGVTWDRAPQIFNVGYDVIELALANKLVLGGALTLLVLKLVATSLTLGSGGSGGVFAPGLFMGAMMGTVFDIGIRAIFPGISAPPGAYALVGMAAFFSATAHAPITAVLILFELTGDYRIILPLMLTVVITTMISQRLLKGESVYTLKLSRRGVRLNRGRDVDVMEGVLVSEVMSHEFNIISTQDTLASFSKLTNQTHSHGAAILDEGGKFWGIITISDLEKAINDKLDFDKVKVSAVGSHGSDLLVSYPDETIGQALYRMSPRDLGRLPVVSRRDPQQLLGLIRRQDIIRAYHLALSRRSEISHRAKQLKIDDDDELEIVNFIVSEGADIIGKTVKEFSGEMPADSLLVSIKRDDRMVIPHGDTKISSGDSISIILKNEDIEGIYKLFHS